jgi:hypothetical protein
MVADAYKSLALELEQFRRLSFAELERVVGQQFSNRLSGELAEFEMTITIRRLDRPAEAILVAGTVGPISWGSPHSRVDDQFVVVRPTDMLAQP